MIPRGKSPPGPSGQGRGSGFQAVAGSIPGPPASPRGINFGSISDGFWVYFGAIWYQFGINLGSFWDRFGIDLGSVWDRVGIVLGSSGDCFVIDFRLVLDRVEAARSAASILYKLL